jgi:hypothetical protein
MEQIAKEEEEHKSRSADIKQSICQELFVAARDTLGDNEQFARTRACFRHVQDHLLRSLEALSLEQLAHISAFILRALADNYSGFEHADAEGADTQTVANGCQPLTLSPCLDVLRENQEFGLLRSYLSSLWLHCVIDGRFLRILDLGIRAVRERAMAASTATLEDY